MARRTHELVFNETTTDRSYDDRLGFEYTEGSRLLDLIHPDSQSSVRHHDLEQEDVVKLRDFCEMVLEHMETLP